MPIIVRADSGFFDQKLMADLEALGVGYLRRASSMTICRALSPGSGNRLGDLSKRGSRVERYVELGDRRGNWKKFRRALFCQPLYEDRQRLLEFARPDQILYTNLGCGSGVDPRLERWLEAEALLEGYHGRGADELVHRDLKDFASQTLPFKRFPANAAFYYTMRVAFFLYESFKHGRLRSGGAQRLVPRHLARRPSWRERSLPRRADSESDHHLGAASNPATVGEDWNHPSPLAGPEDKGYDCMVLSKCSLSADELAPALHLFFTPSDICILRDAQRELPRSDSLTSLSISANEGNRWLRSQQPVDDPTSFTTEVGDQTVRRADRAHTGSTLSGLSLEFHQAGRARSLDSQEHAGRR